MHVDQVTTRIYVHPMFNMSLAGSPFGDVVLNTCPMHVFHLVCTLWVCHGGKVVLSRAGTYIQDLCWRLTDILFFVV